MAQASDDCISDAVHSNANADITRECVSKEYDSELKAVLQAVVESHNRILASQIVARIDEFEKKMHVCWTSLQEQMTEQQHKSSLQDERFERFESAFLSHSDGIKAVARELSALRGDIKQAASATSCLPQEAEQTQLEEQAELEHEIADAWEASPPYPPEENFGRQQQQQSGVQVKLEDYQSLPFPSKLFVTSGEIACTAPSQSQPAVLVGSEGSMSDLSGHSQVGEMSSSGVEAVLKQNLHHSSAPDGYDEWSYWSIEPKEQLAIANDASSSRGTAGQSKLQISTGQGATDSNCDRNLRIGVDDVRTVMIKNIPCRYSNQDMLDVFAELGFGNEPIFFHLPSRYKQDTN